MVLPGMESCLSIGEDALLSLPLAAWSADEAEIFQRSTSSTGSLCLGDFGDGVVPGTPALDHPFMRRVLPSWRGCVFQRERDGHKVNA